MGRVGKKYRKAREAVDKPQYPLTEAIDVARRMGGTGMARAWALGEVGKCGVAISSLEDMETLFDGIPLADISTSMTINSTASILLALYVAVARRQGVDPAGVSGTIQNDILKEYIAQKEYIFPPEPSMRLVTDTVEFGTNVLQEPLFHYW